MRAKKDVSAKVDSSAMSLEKSPVSERSKFSDMFYSMCYYQVRGKKMLKYSYSEFRSVKQKEQIELINNDSKETYKGDMSKLSRKNLRKKVEIWNDACNAYNNTLLYPHKSQMKKLVFFTLTLSSIQYQSDKKVKELLLKPFFRKASVVFGLKNYVWKAESQKNGNIHFHCIADVYIDKEALTRLWNAMQAKFSYIDEFEKKYNHRNPPSTEIRVVQNESQMFDYLEKYICKDEDYRRIEGACWKASRELLSLQYFEFEACSEVDLKIDQLASEQKISTYSDERYMIINFKDEKIEDVLPQSVNDQRVNYYILLTLFLFSDTAFTNFRDFCYCISAVAEDREFDNLFITRQDYPAPVQLALFQSYEFYDTYMAGKNRVRILEGK